MNLQVATPPAVEPVSLDIVKMNARITHDVEDSVLSLWISTGRELAEIYLRRALINQTVEISLESFPETPFNLLRSPVSSITSVKYFDVNNLESTVTNTLYALDSSCSPARIYLTYGASWPSVVLREFNSVKIRYVAGYGATGDSVPSCIRDAIILYCGYRDMNRIGESYSAPKQFYDLLKPKRIYLGKD